MAKNQSIKLALLNERPLVTFALFAYNQEKYIREALEGAFAQTYEPLEIILSDDCSTDRTFEIMEEMAVKYEGPHKLRLNRNIRNLGICRHIHAVMELIRTDFVVVAGGDDISESARTSELVLVWLNSNGEALSIHSLACEINDLGEKTGKFRKGISDESLNNPLMNASQTLGVLGATQAWDMLLIRNFKPMISGVINEDVVLPSRAALLGRVKFVDKPLVRYRIGVGVTHEVGRRRAAGFYDLTYEQMKIPYRLFLQKYSDYQEAGVLEKYRSEIRSARASTLFPIWLRSRRTTAARVCFFARRCRSSYLLWELLKFKLPRLVEYKQKVQFWLRS